MKETLVCKAEQTKEQPKEQPEENNMISMDKKYQTKDGKKVRVLCVDVKDEDYPVLALVLVGDSESVQQFTKNGYLHSEHSLDEWDLIEVSTYADFKVDEPVMVREHDGGTWQPRHFAVIGENGKPRCWSDGKTSWSGAPTSFGWDQCRRPTPEELKGQAK